MPIPTCNVTITVNLQSGEPAAGMRVIAELTRPDKFDGFVVRSSEQSFLNSSGKVVLPLFKNVLGETGSQYRVRALGPRGELIMETFATVPDLASANIEDISDLGPPTPANVALEAAASATAAALSADEAEASANAAELSKNAAAASATVAVSAAEASGDIKFFDTYALADAATLDEGQVVEVFVDETRGGIRARYRFESAALVFKLDLTAVDTVVDNVTALRALVKASPSVGNTVQLLGYTNPGDGGGGLFYFDADDTTTADDGGTVIVAGDGARWKRAALGRASCRWWGAFGGGATNETTAMKAFFDYCIAENREGFIDAGEYVITAGELVFDNEHVEAPWPFITTAGFGSVSFKRADATDEPMISITNGTAVSAAGKFWRGGALGGITFDQNGKAKAANQHGLLLLGIVGTSFGHMRMNDSGGSCICIPEKLFSVTNPDPYNVSCFFDGAEANRCDGYAFFNNNGVGLTGCTIKYIRAIENVGGAFFGFGTGTTIDLISAGSCSGWALGNRTDAVGSAQRFTLGVAEFDDMQYGIDMRRVSNSVFGVSAIRFVHRYNFGPLNPAGGYWPRIVAQVSTNAVAMNTLRIIDRLEAGGTKGDLGQFFDFGNGGGNTGDIIIQRQTIDNASLGILTADYYTNFNNNAAVLYTVGQGQPVIDTLNKTVAVARAATSFAVPNGGFTGADNTVQYSTELSDISASYDPATWTYTTRTAGVYRIAARIVLAVAIDTRIRMAIMVNGSAAVSRFFYATTANAQCYDIDYEAVIGAAGATININADQNTGSAVNLTIMTNANENTFSVTQI